MNTPSLPSSSIRILTSVCIAFFLLSEAGAANESQELTKEDVLRLKNALDTVVVTLHESILLERELEAEGVVGRAMLLLERRKELEKSMAETNDMLLAFCVEKSLELEWLLEWHESYTTLIRRTPSRMAYYQLLDPEKAAEYVKLAGLLHRNLADVVESGGEKQIFEEMKLTREQIQFLEKSITTKRERNRLTKEEVNKLTDAVHVGFSSSYQASALEHEIEKETVIGRAFLNFEKKKALELEVQKINNEVESLNLRGIGRIEWLDDWSNAYRTLIHGTPSRLFFYQRTKNGEVEDYAKLVNQLTRDLIDVIESNGESSKVDAMKEIQQAITAINEAAINP